MKKFFTAVSVLLVFCCFSFAFGCKGKGSPVPEEGNPRVIYTLSEDGTFFKISGYSGEIRDIEILSYYEGRPVLEITENAFKDCKSLNSVVIADEVKKIGGSAFFGCSALIDVSFGHGTREIGEFAFHGCTALSEISLPANVKTIGNGAFYGCENLSGVKFASDEIDTIGWSAFFECKKLVKIHLPGALETVSQYAFSGCEKLSSVFVGAGTRNIEKGAFSECSALSKIYYDGTEENWNFINISVEDNDALSGATVYFRSDDEPTVSGNFWHYSDGEIAVW